MIAILLIRPLVLPLGHRFLLGSFLQKLICTGEVGGKGLVDGSIQDKAKRGQWKACGRDWLSGCGTAGQFLSRLSGSTRRMLPSNIANSIQSALVYVFVRWRFAI
jgi:hypothetical protein